MESKPENTYDFLWQVHQREKNNTELQPIPKAFYKESMENINNIRPDAMNNNRLRENALKLLNEITERRKQKILIYVAYKKPLPQSNIEEEMNLYSSLLNIVKDNTFTQQCVQVGCRLKVLSEVPEIMLPSGAKVGPLSKDQIIELSNREDIEYMKGNGICENT